MNTRRFTLVASLLGALAAPCGAADARHPTTYRMYAAFKSRMSAPPAPFRARNAVRATVEGTEPLRIRLSGSWLDPRTGRPFPVEVIHNAARAEYKFKNASGEIRRQGRWSIRNLRAYAGPWMVCGGRTQEDLALVLDWIEQDDAELIRRLQSLAQAGPTRPDATALEDAVRFAVPTDAIGVQSRLIVNKMGLEWHRQWLDIDEAKRHAVVNFALKPDQQMSLSRPFRLLRGSGLPGIAIENGRGWRCSIGGDLIDRNDAARYFRSMKVLNDALFATQPTWCYELVPDKYESALRREAFDAWVRRANLTPEQMDKWNESVYLEIRWLPKGIERRRAERAARDGYDHIKRRYDAKLKKRANLEAHWKAHLNPIPVPVLKQWNTDGWTCRLYGQRDRGKLVALHADGFVVRGGWNGKSSQARARQRMKSLIESKPESGEPFWGE